MNAKGHLPQDRHAAFAVQPQTLTTCVL